MDVVRFGVVRELVGDREEAKVARVTAAISHCFGKGVELIVADSYAALLQSFARGELDAAWFTPAMVVEASRRTKLTLIAGSTREHSSDYVATLVVRAASGLKRLEDLRGTRAGWVDPWSAAGYLYPRRLLRDAGLDPATLFSKQKFYGSHPAVLKALRDDEIDVCATYLDHDGHLRAVEGFAPGELVALGPTASIPSDALCLSERVPPEEVARLTACLEGLASSELAATLEAQGFVTRPLADYAMVRALLDDEWGRSSLEPTPAREG